MKYKKPDKAIRWLRGESSQWGSDQEADILVFLDSLPAEFEIVPDGMVAVKWPKEATKESILWHADSQHGRGLIADSLYALAAIAPEEKKPEKRRVYILQFQGHGENHGRLELSFNANPQFPFIKVGECEVTE